MSRFRLFGIGRGATGLPAISFTASALNATTISFSITGNAAYASYVAYLNEDFGNAYPIVGGVVYVHQDGATYDIQVAGKTSGGVIGPRTAIKSVTMSSGSAGSVGAGATAKMADTLVRKFSTNCHWTFQTNAWWQPANSAAWLAALKDIGYRHVRSFIGTDSSHPSWSYMNELYADAGITVDAMVALPAGGNFDIPSLLERLDFIASIGQEKVHFIGMGNEINGGNVTGTIPEIAQKAYDLQAYVYPIVKSRFGAGMKLSSPSVKGRSTEMLNALAALGIGDYCDFYEIHNYANGRGPWVSGIADGITDNGGDAEIAFSDIKTQHALVAPGKPGIVTEFGWQSYDPASANPGAIAAGVLTDEAAAAYILMGYFYYHLQGMEFINQYAIVNNTSTTLYGILDQNKIGSPVSYRAKVAQARLKRWFALYDDPGADFTPGSLNYAFTGAGADGNLLHDLHQRRDGKFLITTILQREKWQRSAPRMELNPTASVNLTFPGGAVSNVKRYQPDVSGTATDLGSNSSFAATLPANVNVFEVTP